MKKYKSLIFITGYLFIQNIVFALLVYNHITLSNTIFYLLESITISSIISLITIPFKDKISKIIRTSLLSIITLFFIAQFVHYNFYDCFFSIFSLVNGGQVFGFLSAIIKEIIDNLYGIVIMLILFILSIIFLIRTSEEKPKFIVIFIVLVINVIITVILTLVLNTNYLYSRKNLVTITNSEVKNCEKFGLLTGMVIDTKRYMFSYDEDLLKYNNTKYVFKEDNNSTYNITDIDFNEVDKSVNNDKIKTINNYFKSDEPTNKNDYTGIFKGKNLIFITAESLYFNAIDKDITPTLYKMTNNGLVFTNFYTPIYYASTSDGEYTNLTGLLPKEGTWSYISSRNNVYPYTYSNVFKKDGYKTYAYHNGIYNFYDRDTVMPNFGYDKYTGCGNGLESKINCNLWPQSDDEMLNTTFNDYKYDKHFMTYYMSISTHLSHDFNTNDIAKKHKNKVDKLKYSSNVKAYISACIELDNAMKNLINNLKKNDLLKDTVIVLVPDHYPYGLSNDELNEFSKLNTTYDKYKSGLIIYNEELKHEEIDKYASNVDVLPTLLNMFGIKYDSRLIIGKDIMSNNEGIVIFNDRSFLTEKGYYNETKSKFYYIDKKTSKEYIERKRKEAFNKTNISSMMLDTNYYKVIEKD